MPAILFTSPHDNPDDYAQAFREAFPGHDWWAGEDAITDKSAVEVALVWAPNPGLLTSLPNLKVVCNLGAGVDGILKDPTYPRDVPLARLIDPALTLGMTEFVVHRVLTFFRGFHRFDQNQRKGQWLWEQPDLAQDCRVGILGLGELGAHAARRLASMDFQVAGWSRSLKELHRVESFVGDDKLNAFLNRTDILVNLLPLTRQTRGILDAQLFAQLPQGAYVINAARGDHLVEEDLIAALDSGHLAGAALDVFSPEPLPEGHVFWARDDILITPHIASITNPKTASGALIKVIKDVLAGKSLEDISAIVDTDRGY